MLASISINAYAGDNAGGKLLEIRQLPSNEMELAFSKLDYKEKIELFFEANRRHPPYSGLNDAFGKEGKPFLVSLRRELDSRGGVPEVLSFLVILSKLKHQGDLSSKDMGELRVKGICQLAHQSQYCPELESKLLAPK